MQYGHTKVAKKRLREDKMQRQSDTHKVFDKERKI
jgi:hypothetical protein